MMKPLPLLATIMLFLLFATSCSQEQNKITPYNDPAYREAWGNIESITERTYGKNNRLSYIRYMQYDSLGRMVLTYYIEGRDTSKWALEYDEDGYMLPQVNSDSTGFYPEYDTHGKMTTERYVARDQSGDLFEYSFNYTYNENGNITSSHKVSPLPDDISETEYTYAPNGKQSKRTFVSAQQNIEASCDTATGLIDTIRFYNADKELSTEQIYSYKFDTIAGNWIEAKVKDGRKTIKTISRDIKYFPDDLAAQQIYEPKEFTSIAVIDNYFNDVFSRNIGTTNTPGLILSIILILGTCGGTAYALYRFRDLIFANFSGRLQSNGMKRLWMYNAEPYIKVGSMILIAIVVFIATILAIVIIGAVVWGIFWIIKLILWGLIIVGWILLIIGIIGLLGRSAYGCLPLIIGGIIVSWQDGMSRLGEDLVAWGFQFMQEVNIFDWGLKIFVNYWDVILVTFLTPLVLFLAFALVVIILNTLLNVIELVITRIYSIRRPCPVCGHTGTPDYIIGGRPHPVKLQPGLYGVFTQLSPVTGDKIPTMLLNGRGKITRKCRNCGHYISSDAQQSFGTELHIGFVGPRSSGKSYLLYSGLATLIKTYPKRLEQTDADNTTNIENYKRRIDNRSGIQTAVANRYRAVQLMLKSNSILHPLPWHLFFYDVAGEKFNAGSSSHRTAMDFYRNVQSIAFIVDPSMLETSGIPTSKAFDNWLIANGNNERHRIDSSFSVLKEILETVGRNSGTIKFNFVCTKADMGYFRQLKYSASPSESEIERFMTQELGLANLINSAKASFSEVHFFSVSAISNDAERIGFFKKLIEQLGASL